MSEATIVSSPVREIDGRCVPAAGAWTVDTSHSRVGFVVRHLMVAKVRGRFADYDVNFEVGERPEDSTLSVTIQSGSITTGDEGRDAHLKSGDFLDVERHPTLTFVSTGVRPAKDSDKWTVDGNLTINGVTKPVQLEVEFGGAATDPWGNDKAFFNAETEFDRDDFGLTWNQPLANGGVLVGKKIKVEIEIEASPVAS